MFLYMLFIADLYESAWLGRMFYLSQVRVSILAQVYHSVWNFVLPKTDIQLQTCGKIDFIEGWTELFGERWFAVKVIRLAGIKCDHETEMLILTMYWKKVFESIKYFTNVFDPMPG